MFLRKIHVMKFDMLFNIIKAMKLNRNYLNNYNKLFIIMVSHNSKNKQLMMIIKLDHLKFSVKIEYFS
jgi:hypothetical protein